MGYGSQENIGLVRALASWVASRLPSRGRLCYASSMILFPCPSCKRSVSKQAKTCPQCGHAFKRDNQMSLKDPVHLIGALLILVLVIAFIGGMIRGL